MSLKPFVMRFAFAICLIFGKAHGNDDLAESFIRPPAAARPWVFWNWINGNITREGVTADLESMARVGIGGVLIFEVDLSTPKGNADFAGPVWIQHLLGSAHKSVYPQPAQEVLIPRRHGLF